MLRKSIGHPRAFRLGFAGVRTRDIITAQDGLLAASRRCPGHGGLPQDTAEAPERRGIAGYYTRNILAKTDPASAALLGGNAPGASEDVVPPNIIWESKMKENNKLDSEKSNQLAPSQGMPPVVCIQITGGLVAAGVLGGGLFGGKHLLTKEEEKIRKSNTMWPRNLIFL